MPLPALEGFQSYTSSESPSRLVVYAKSGLVLKAKSYPGDPPAVVIETNQSTFGFLYSELTTNAYSKDSATLSDKQRRLKIIDFLDWTNEFATQNYMISGDMNVHWESPNVSKSAISDWCQSFGFK